VASNHGDIVGYDGGSAGGDRGPAEVVSTPCSSGFMG